MNPEDLETVKERQWNQVSKMKLIYNDLEYKSCYGCKAHLLSNLQLKEIRPKK